MRVRPPTALLLVATTLLVAHPAHAQSFDVQSHALANGMRILVHEDHSTQAATMYIFYRVGSRNENVGATGLSHFFEHMMFNGAKKYGAGEFDRVMEAAGGSNNAYTSKDVTVYHQTFPPSALELIFDLEADRMQDLDLSKEKVESERGAVINERGLSIDNDNWGTLSEQLWATAFIAHPYRWEVMGWMVDIKAWTLDELRRHYAIGYSPSNATMVVVGDVKAAEVFRLAEKYVGPLAKRDAPPPVRTVEPPQLGERRIVVKKTAQLPHLMVAYHVPGAKDPDMWPLWVTWGVLLQGESSRLHQRLVEVDQTTLSIDGGWGFTFDPTLFLFAAEIADGTKPQAVEDTLYEELAKLAAKDGISDRELQKVKNGILAQFYRDMQTAEGKAHAIGEYQVFFDDYRMLFEVPKKIAAVTKEDVQRVAAKYFKEDNRTVATLVPAEEIAETGDEEQPPATRPATRPTE